MSDVSLSLFNGAVLARGRTHEVFGAGARAFAAMVAGASPAPGKETVVWVRPAGARAQLNPLGLADFLDPARILLADCARPLDILWTVEETLRLGAAGLVVAELARPPDLKISRRLQLAAEAGGGLGLCLVDDTPVTNAAETRWFCAPSPSLPVSSTPVSSTPVSSIHGPAPAATDSTRWRLSLIKNKKGTLGAWEIEWDAKARAVAVVSRLAGGPDGEARRLAGRSDAVRRGARGKERPAAVLPE